MSKSVLAVSEARLERAGPDVWRVAGTVAGSEVFFESNVPLVPRAEALVSPFLIPAMALHADLEVAGPLDPGFLRNLAALRERAIQWWPELSAGEVHAAVAEPAPPAADAGVFYTGGIDSSYVLQQLHPRLRHAVFVEGFDIRLDHLEHLRRAREALGATVGACGLDFVIVRTNLRTHPLSRIVHWEKNHIGPLGAIAHVMAAHVNTMYVAASDVPPPWGSAPELDALWSSDAVRIENYSAELSRLQRAASIGNWEPLRGRLRPCWAPNPKGLNCGKCEKCVRTRMQLSVTGSRDALGSFDNGPPLLEAIGDLSEVDPHLAGQWREVAVAVRDPRLKREVDRLLAGRPQPYWRRRLRRVRRAIAGRFRNAFPDGGTELKTSR